MAWAADVWRDAGVPFTTEQVREMAYTAGRTVVQAVFLPYAEKNGGIELVVKLVEALSAVPGWDPPDPDLFLDSYDTAFERFVGIVEPYENIGAVKTAAHENIEAILWEARNMSGIDTNDAHAELLFSGALRALAPTWTQDIRDQARQDEPA
jgi:hypothetical protein